MIAFLISLFKLDNYICCVKRNKYFLTLVAISKILIFGKVKRHSTPRECARLLQCFAEDF